jgi:hypothetical protein
LPRRRRCHPRRQKLLRGAIEEFKQSSPLVQKVEEKPAAKSDAPPPDGKGPLQAARRATERETTKER